MSDGFPLGFCSDATLPLGEVDEDEDHSLPVYLVSGRGRKMCEFRIRCVLGLRVLWRAMRVAQLIVAPVPDGGRAGCNQRR